MDSIWPVWYLKLNPNEIEDSTSVFLFEGKPALSALNLSVYLSHSLEDNNDIVTCAVLGNGTADVGARGDLTPLRFHSRLSLAETLELPIWTHTHIYEGSVSNWW